MFDSFELEAASVGPAAEYTCNSPLEDSVIVIQGGNAVAPLPRVCLDIIQSFLSPIDKTIYT